ncbi:MAG: hypothetical protein ABIO88_15375, partial [Burkholderiaceae bacterium]
HERANAMTLRMTCKQAAALLVAREDRDIDFVDKVGLRLHLLACKACPNFEKQLLIMRNSMKQWRHYSNEGTADSEQ